MAKFQSAVEASLAPASGNGKYIVPFEMAAIVLPLGWGLKSHGIPNNPK